MSSRSLNSSSSSMSSLASIPSDLSVIVDRMRDQSKGITIKDLKYHLIKYRKCFVGRKAVNWIIENGLASTREEAVELGQRLIRHNVIHHVAFDHNFKDAKLFYRFYVDDDIGVSGPPNLSTRRSSFLMGSTKVLRMKKSFSTGLFTKARTTRSVSGDSEYGFPVGKGEVVKRTSVDDLSADLGDGCDISRIPVLKDVTVLEKLGEGSYGKVFYGRWQDVTPVALKMIKKTSSDTNKEMLQELCTLASVNHPHVVRLLGLFDAPHTGEMFIVTEYMSEGTLSQLLRRSSKVSSSQEGRTWSRGSSFSGSPPPSPLPPPLIDDSEVVTHDQLARMCVQICAGMNYISGMNIIHRDLAARNILLSLEGSNYVCKIADLGLGRYVSDGTVYLNKDAPIPVRWSAPEAIKGTFTTASDVYSFGVTMWETYHEGQIPYTGLSNKEVSKAISSGNLLQQGLFCPPAAFQIMEGCWKWDPEQRPSFKILLYKCKDLIRQLVGGEYEMVSPSPSFEESPLQQSHEGIYNNLDENHPQPNEDSRTSKRQMALSGQGLEELRWDPKKFETGVPLIDSQHRGLVETLNLTIRTFRGEKRHRKPKIMEILQKLGEYAVTHFVDEEALFEGIGYPASQAHIRIHSAFTDQVSSLFAKFLRGKEIKADLLEFLKNWITDHILKSDQEYVPYVRSKLAVMYDVKKRINFSKVGQMIDDQGLLIPILWNDEFCSGLAFLDRNHKKLFQCVNELQESINNDNLNSDPEGIRDAFNTLAECRVDLNYEDDILATLEDCPDFEDHMESHQLFRDALSKGLDQLREGEEIDMALIRFFRNWLLYHSLGADKTWIPYCLLAESKKMKEKATSQIAKLHEGFYELTD